MMRLWCTLKTKVANRESIKKVLMIKQCDDNTLFIINF
jgi:hypothetical protein